MKTLSKEAEEQVIQAIKSAVSAVDDEGLSPDEAIEKQARANQWGPEMVRFACHAYNNGRQTAQWQGGETTLDKLAEFPLADPEAVIGRMWPNQVKTARDRHLSDTVSDEYDRPPTFLQDRARTCRHKAAADRDLVLVSNKPEAPAGDPREDMRRTYNEHLRLKRAAEEARHWASVKYEELMSKLGELRSYFKKHAQDRLPLGPVEKTAVLHWGDSVQNLFDYVVQCNRTKEARSGDSRYLDQVNIDHTPFAQIDRCVKLAQEVRQWREEENRRREALDNHAHQKLAHYASSAPDPTPPGRILEEPQTTKLASGLLSGAMGGAAISATKDLLNKATEDKPKGEKIEDSWLQLDDPQHEAEIQQVRAQAMLSDMMDDDVISGYEPQDVLKAYNEVAQLAPRAAEQPTVMRSLIRRQLQGDLEPFEAQQMADIEKSVKETDNEGSILKEPEKPLIESSGGGSQGKNQNQSK